MDCVLYSNHAALFIIWPKYQFFCVTRMCLLCSYYRVKWNAMRTGGKHFAITLEMCYLMLYSEEMYSQLYIL